MELDAYEELSQTGQCGAATVELLLRLCGQVVRTSSFPPPPEYQDWSEDAIYDLLTDMFSKKGPAFVLACLTKATDTKSLERLLFKAIRNHLIDGAKGTERGKLRRRLQTLLTADARFVAAPGPGWSLATHPEDAVWQGDVEQLERAAAAVRGVVLGKLPSSGPTPRGSAEALLTVSHEVLLAAGGVVREEDLARVLESRFALLSPPEVVALTADERFTQIPSSEDGPETIVAEADERARELWDTLSQTERSLVPHLSGTVEDVMAVAEVGRHTAESLRAALLQKLHDATLDDEHQDATLRALLHLCRTRP